MTTPTIVRCAAYCGDPLFTDDAGASCGDHEAVCDACVGDGWASDCLPCASDIAARAADLEDDRAYVAERERAAL